MLSSLLVLPSVASSGGTGLQPLASAYRHANMTVAEMKASLRERGEDTLAQAIEDLRDARGSTETLRAARALRETELRESERTTKV